MVSESVPPKLPRFALTAEQARILYDLADEYRDEIISTWSFGVWDGLINALTIIERHQGAYVSDLPYLPRHEPHGVHPARGRPPSGG